MTHYHELSQLLTALKTCKDCPRRTFHDRCVYHEIKDARARGQARAKLLIARIGRD